MTTSPPADWAPATWTPNKARDHDWTCPAVSAEVRGFHRTLPDYAPTTLADLPGLAREPQVASVFAKDESNRLKLPAFKGLRPGRRHPRPRRQRGDPMIRQRPTP